MSDRSAAENFVASAEAFVDLVAAIEPAAWSTPALGVWSVRELVGHTSRSLTTVPAYLAAPAATADVADAAGYFLTVLETTTHEAVAERGRVAAQGLGPDPVATVQQQARAAIQALAGADDAAMVATPAGGMRLTDYLPTRTFELTVHSLDLMLATGMQRDLPSGPVTAAAALALELAMRQGRAVEVLLALNNRRPLSAGFGIL